jgi:hypothetical protein
MHRPDAAQLARECALFCRYLADVDATQDIVRAYQRAHEVETLKMNATTPFDRALLQLAAGGPALTRIADAFAGPVAPGSVLRKKLVLLIAILESRGASSERVDRAVPGSPVVWAIGAAFLGAGWLLRFVVGAMLLAPLRLWHAVSEQR